MTVGAPPGHPTTSVLFFYVLGKLHEAHASAIDRHVRGCKRCRQLAACVENDVADFALALEPVPVSPFMRESLLHNAREVHRLSDALPTLRRALRCSLADAQAVLSKVDAPCHWQQRRGAWVLPLSGPAPHGAELVRLSLDARYSAPPSRTSQVHVLQGHARTTLGPLRAGRAVKVPPGSRFAAYPGPDVLLLFTWRRPRASGQMPTQVGGLPGDKRSGDKRALPAGPTCPARSTGPTSNG